MPTIKIHKDRFHELMGRQYKFQDLDNLGFQFGIQVEEDIEHDKDLKVDIPCYKFDCMNNRPDLLAENTLVRALKIYLGEIDTPQMKLTKPIYTLTVDPSVKQVRPYAIGAILRNISFTQKTYNAFLAIQEKLHATFCRNRKFVAIGTHDLDTLKGPFKYVAKDPKDFKFIPLNQTQVVDGNGMMASLENHKLKQYLHLIRDSPVYPLITDSEGTIGSVPPIINSQHSKISLKTKNVFIDVTGISLPKAMIALNTLVWSFSQYCQNSFQIEPVEVIDGNQRYLTPNIEERQYLVSHKKGQILIGAELKQDQVINYLKRSGFKTVSFNQTSYKVLVPSWRSDVLHECDILQDIAICYGYTKIVPCQAPSPTIGAQLRIHKFIDHLRRQMAQAQFNEALNFALCSKADLTTNINNLDQSKLITIQNAKTRQFQTGRTTLLPGLIRTIIENKSMALPYRLFEAGDCIIMDKTSDTGARNIRRLAAAITDEIVEGTRKDIFSIVHGSLDLIMKKSAMQFGKDYTLKLGKSQFYFPGLQFQIILHGQPLGTLGIVHPQVLKKMGWGHPVAMWQIDVALLQKRYTESFK